MLYNNEPEDNLTINETVEVLKREGFDVSTHKLRQYEKQGLLSPKKSLNKYRLYSDKDLAEIRKILALLVLGFSIKEIKNYKDLKHRAYLIVDNFLGFDFTMDELNANKKETNEETYRKLDKELKEALKEKWTKIDINKNCLVLTRYLNFCERIEEAIENQKKVIDLTRKTFFSRNDTSSFEFVLKKIQANVATK